MINWYRLVRPLLFRLDAESAHNLAFAALRQAQRLAQRTTRAEKPVPTLAQSLWGLSFPNPLGLAAGLDKNAIAPHVWPRLGFGFVELGTITAHAQPGNPRPRLFRLPADGALINRMGFNNEGAAAVAARLTTSFAAGRPPVPIGLNLGKSRVTPIEVAVDDYLVSLNKLFRHADYIVVNVSSPNTPGLRDLQGESQLRALLGPLREENERLARTHEVSPRPILIKLAPDLSEDGLAAAVDVALEERASGIIATNTTLRRDGLTVACDEAGGLSGRPLRTLSTQVIRTLYKRCAERLPIIGVGGVASAAEAYEKIRAGASLVQIYTSLIYGGPALPRHINQDLGQLVERQGLSHIRQAIGSDAA